MKALHRNIIKLVSGLSSTKRSLIWETHGDTHPPAQLLLPLLQETDDEDDEESYDIKGRLRAFLRWLQGLDWLQCLRNKRQNSAAVA